MSEVSHRGIGGAGRIFPASGAPGFVIKVLKLYNENGVRNNLFWEEAKSIQAYCSIFRHAVGFTKIPIAMRFMHLPKGYGENFHYSAEKKEYLQGYRPLPLRCNNRQEAENNSENLAIVYPLRAMEISLQEKLAQKDCFSGDDAVRFLYQLLSAMIFLYQNGCAHSDIKPANIMLDKDNDFVLTDFGSLTNESCNAGSGTESFVPPQEVVSKWQKKYDNAVTFRCAMDCYGLALTLYCMAKGDSIIIGPPNPSKFKRWNEKGEALSTIFEKLRINIPNDFSVAQLSDILAEPLFSEYASKHQIFTPYILRGDIPFDTWNGMVWNGGDIGSFNTQINLVGKSDPLVRITPQVKLTKLEKSFFAENTSCILGALAIDSSHCFLHAPDNAYTEGRMQSEDESYRPKTLVTQKGVLSKTEKERFLFISELLIQNKMDNILLSGEDIIWVDGALMFSPSTGIRISFRFPEQYALMLQGPERLDLLSKLKEKLLPDGRLKKEIIHTPEEFLPGYLERHRHIVPESIIRETVCKKPELFLEDFKRGLPFEFERQEWFSILRCTKKCNSFCPESIRADFFAHKWAAKHRAMRKFQDGIALSFKEWSELICQDPQKLEQMPESQLRELSPNAWIRLLGIRPELIEQCPHTATFSETQWGSILLLQPQLRKHCHQQQWSEKSLRRLKKRLNF